jgi:4-hydroxy-2-oxovalerate/4-hydroxy-2-oxohexanoate aldolase
VSATRFTDTSMRDGSHTVAHRLTVAQVETIASVLHEGNVPVIEVAHGDGLGGSSFNYGFSAVDQHDLIAAAATSAPGATIAVLLIPGIGIADDLEEVRRRGASMVRVATHCTEADISAQHIRLARDLGMEAVGFLMMSHMQDPPALADQARLMESYGADTVYVVDSAGALVPDSARARVAALRSALAPTTEVGFHAHDNLGAAVANTLAAIEEGATRVDGSLGGLGAGAGNLATEAFAAVAERSGIETGLDVLRLARGAEATLELLGVRPARTRETLALGYAGVYSSFLLHADRAARRFDLDAADILVELGRRRVVGGQEDMIVDVAAELASSACTQIGK